MRLATIAALIEHGLDGLVVENIAATAGVNKTTIYRRWGTREALVADALVANSGEKIEVPDTGSVRADLVGIARQVRDAIIAPASRALMSALAGGRHHPELQDIGHRFWAGRFAAVRPVIDRAIDRGELPADVNHDAVLSHVLGPIWFRVFGPGHDVDDTFVESCVDLVLTGVRGRAA
ncbi:TetR/AcrR family transcriptional regulator [Tenggerimyces flavus]|uniref:TetR/AcrR family transcriptional regulator n=1 Tax=Tenggerimyces flavus TaxID=1708749 RepID=A0ABV7YLH9_9ACTN|nr:TetR/AcrR family transcriptional regulator [Tenggerimyces flavus]MBM7790308.1 AcrR family transcriptional regulator [Tenggerimyces flavus]